MKKQKIEGGTKALVGEGNKLPPVRQIYAGYEIEARQLLLTVEDDYTKQKNAVKLYDETLTNGTTIEQGYIHELFKAKEMLDDLGIEVDFTPSTVRLRHHGKKFILTLKDRKSTKRREVEWELDKKTFNKYWPLTKGARVRKTRMMKEVKNQLVTFDAFTDRYLLMVEVEVQSEEALSKVPKMGMDITGQKQWTNKSLAR